MNVSTDMFKYLRFSRMPRIRKIHNRHPVRQVTRTCVSRLSGCRFFDVFLLTLSESGKVHVWSDVLWQTLIFSCTTMPKLSSMDLLTIPS